MLTTFYFVKNDHRWVTFIFLKTIHACSKAFDVVITRSLSYLSVAAICGHQVSACDFGDAWPILREVIFVRVILQFAWVATRICVNFHEIPNFEL